MQLSSIYRGRQWRQERLSLVSSTLTWSRCGGGSGQGLASSPVLCSRISNPAVLMKPASLGPDRAERVLCPGDLVISAWIGEWELNPDWGMGTQPIGWRISFYWYFFALRGTISKFLRLAWYKSHLWGRVRQPWPTRAPGVLQKKCLDAEQGRAGRSRYGSYFCTLVH